MINLNMMKNFNTPILIILIILFESCNGRPKISTLDLNWEKWKNDPFACNNQRSDIGDSIIKYRENFSGLDTSMVLKYLGTPDIRYSGGDYSYYVVPNYNC